MPPPAVDAQIEGMELLHENPSPHALAQSNDPSLAWLNRSLYPFTSREFATPDGRMRYVDEGHGKPILFVHGTPSWSFEWRHLLRQLRDTARVIAPDHLGFGLSDKPPSAAYRPADHARRLLALVRALDLRELTLVVHDFGGPIGLPVLLEKPARVRSLVVLNSWAWPHGSDPRIRKLSRFIASPLGRFAYQWLNASPRWLVPVSFGRRERLTREVHRHYQSPFQRRTDRTAPWTLGVELARSDTYYGSLWDRRSALQSVPSTLIWGLSDPAFGPAYLERFREALPAARVVALEGVGHFPQEEAPDQVLAAVRDAIS